MTARTVDKCLDEIDRLRTKHTATQGHLWRAEWLLRSVEKMLPHLIADSPHNGAARDGLAGEISEFLSEKRQHPGAAVTGDAPDLGKDRVAPVAATEGS